jgi:hypothetical protein
LLEIPALLQNPGLPFLDSFQHSVEISTHWSDNLQSLVGVDRDGKAFSFAVFNLEGDLKTAEAQEIPSAWLTVFDH